MQESDIKLYTEFQQCCSDHHKLQHVCLPRCLSDLVIKGSTDVLSHATWLFSGCGADHDDLEAFSQHSWDSVIRKKIFISWGKEFMMPGFLWVFVPGLISCLCRARCRLRGGFLMLFPFVDSLMWNHIVVHSTVKIQVSFHCLIFLFGKRFIQLRHLPFHHV